MTHEEVVAPPTVDRGGEVQLGMVGENVGAVGVHRGDEWRRSRWIKRLAGRTDQHPGGVVGLSQKI